MAKNGNAKKEMFFPFMLVFAVAFLAFLIPKYFLHIIIHGSKEIPSSGQWLLAIWPGIGLIIMCFLFYFYRDPNRPIVAEKGDILSPADGEIVAIEKINEINGTKGKFIKISIFLNAFNVHIQRMPISGVISNIDVLPGSLLPAFRDEAGKKNKQNIYTIKGDITAVVKQIAGVLVHRPVSWVVEGEKLDIGEQFGMITFGSRVELIIPATCTVESKVGDKVFAGISNLGKIQKTLVKKSTVSGKKSK